MAAAAGCCVRPGLPAPGACRASLQMRTQLQGTPLPLIARTRAVTCRRGLQVQNIADDGFVRDMRIKIKAARSETAAKVEKLRVQFCEAPPVAKFLAWFAASVAAPFAAWWKVAASKTREEMIRYNDFLSDETKKEWAWKRHCEPEWKFWLGVVNFVMGLFMSMLWQVCVPVSIILSIVVPLAVSWIVFHNPILSPIGLACIIMWPLKFVPGAPWVLLI